MMGLSRAESWVGLKSRFCSGGFLVFDVYIYVGGRMVLLLVSSWVVLWV